METFQDLSQLLANSTPAEAYFSQLPEWIQQRAVSQRSSIRSQQELRDFVRQCQQEVL
jgi:hypothetical protein